MRRITAFSTIHNRVWHGIAVGALGLGLAACQDINVNSTPPAEPRTLSREVAAGLAASEQVESTLVPSIRALTNTPVESQIEGLAIFAGLFALADPTAEPPSIEDCVPMLGDGADSDEDGYPGLKTTQTIDCELLGFRIEGTLELMDENDMDPASGFNSELDYRLTVTVDGETLLSSAGDLALWVSSMADEAGYDLYYSGRVAEDGQFAEFESRLIYSGTLEGSFEAGTLAIDGSIAFASNQVDCASLADADRETCQAEVPENGGPSGIQIAVKSTGIEYDMTSCPTALTGGYVDVQDDAGNVLRISYNGCSERSATYNGEPLPLDESHRS